MRCNRCSVQCCCFCEVNKKSSKRYTAGGFSWCNRRMKVRLSCRKNSNNNTASLMSAAKIYYTTNRLMFKKAVECL